MTVGGHFDLKIFIVKTIDMCSEVSTDSTLTEWSSGLDCLRRTQSIYMTRLVSGVTDGNLSVGTVASPSSEELVSYLVLWAQSTTEGYIRAETGTGAPAGREEEGMGRELVN